MTPSALRDIYHQARCKAMQRAVEYRNPVVQEECDLEAWEAVIKACKEEFK